jgi:hypothetical protein
MMHVPEYAGLISESSRRTFGQDPSAPTIKSAVAVFSVYKVDRVPSPAATDAILPFHFTAPSGSDPRYMYRSSPRSTSGRAREALLDLSNKDTAILAHDTLGVLAGASEGGERIEQARVL